MPNTPLPSRNPCLPAIITLYILVLYSFGVFDHSLWTPDEPRVAAVARSVAEGAWVVPQLNDQPFLEQPPLFYWIVALFFRTFGLDEPFRARVVATLFCLGGIAFTYLLVRRLVPSRQTAQTVGWLTTWCLALTLEYFHTAHRLVVDSALVFFTCGASHATLCLLQANGRHHRINWAIWASSLASAAFLTKGVIGLAVPTLFGVAAIFVTRRESSADATAHPRLPFPIELLWIPPLVFAVVAGPWLYSLATELGNQGFKTLLFDNTIARVVPSLAGDRAHVRPFYYYLSLPAHAVPTLFFVIGGVVHRFSRRAPPTKAERQAYDVLLVWALAGLLMLSLASTKRAAYFVPFFPAVAGIAGIWLNAFLSGRQGRYETALPYVLAVFLFIGGLALVVTPIVVPSLPTVTLLLGAGLAAGFGWGTVRAVGRRGRSAGLVVWGTGLLCATTFACAGLLPATDRMKSLAKVSREVAARVPREDTLYAFDPDETTLGMIPLYAGRPLVGIDDSAQIASLLQKVGSIYVLAVDKTYRRRQRRFDALEAFPTELLLKDERPSSRAFRLYRLTAP